METPLELLQALRAGPEPLVLLHGRVIDGLGSEPLDDGFVVCRGGRIESVGSMSAYRRPTEATSIELDVGGRTLLPGLIDCHAHLVYDGFTTLDALDRCSVETATINALLNAGRVLRAGYTTIRDVGTVANAAVAVRDAIDAGKVPGPRIVASGQIISPTGGLGDTLPPSWERVAGGLGVIVDGAADVLKVVRRQIRAGVDNVKLAASGVEVGPYAYTWMTTMREDEITTAVHEAHRWGRTTAVHCQSYDAVKYALRAGSDTIEHATRLDDEGIALFQRGDSVLVPTMCTLFSVLELGETLNLKPKQREEMAVNEPLWLKSVADAYAAGVPIAAGGDLGNRYPHGTNAREIRHLVRAGLSPMDAIRAATGVAARALRREHLVGALEAGRRADVIVVDGDPLADVTVLEDHARMALVIKDGRLVSGARYEAAFRG
ncbi:MAG: amidohydrolase family protein [Ectothiorhodospiraceae bacterium]|nr:amidohydrolase family protein [Chromatiales bacterium]MCP5155512.1 amidohydrolase family protein [Ectothiorhodospiraceae bacterium]